MVLMWIHIFHNQYNQFNDGDRQFLQSNHITSNGNIKIVAFSDVTYSDLAFSWYDQLTALGYTHHVVLAMDEETLSKGKQRPGNIRIEPYFTEKESLRNLWYRRIQYLKEQISNGTSVLLTDVDNIFLRFLDIQQEFYNTDFDIIFAHEMKFPVPLWKKYGFVTCAGMIWFKATDNSLAFLNMWENVCLESGTKGTMKCNDQIALNTVLHEQIMMTWEYDQEDIKKQKSIRIQSNDENNELVQVGMIGKGRHDVSTDGKFRNFSVRILSRDLAWRGRLPSDHCPSVENNWVAMPTALPFKYSMKSKIEDKILMWKFWIKYCGRQGTNWNRDTITDPIQAAIEKVQQ